MRVRRWYRCPLCGRDISDGGLRYHAQRHGLPATLTWQQLRDQFPRVPARKAVSV